MTSVSVRGRATVHGPARAVSHGPVRAAVEICVEVLGDELTAYLSGANSVGEFRGWCAGPVLSTDSAARRVAAAAEVVSIFEMVNRTALTGPWLSEVGPSGIIPARALRESSGDPATVKVLHEAAEMWILQE